MSIKGDVDSGYDDFDVNNDDSDDYDDHNEYDDCDDYDDYNEYDACDDYDVNDDLNRFILGVPLNHTKISPGIVCVRLSHPDLQHVVTGDDDIFENFKLINNVVLGEVSTDYHYDDDYRRLVL